MTCEVIVAGLVRRHIVVVMPAPAFGTLLHTWRQRRKLSQLDLAGLANVSQRHVSFVESGRSQPSRDMVLHLARHLEVPLRDQNALLAAAGYAPAFQERPLDTPAMATAMSAVQRILDAHDPHPALAVDRHWNLLAANRTVPFLMEGAAQTLLAPPVNVLRLSLHPDGLAARIDNYREWRAHVVHRLARQVDLSGDPVLATLLQEIAAYPTPASARPHRPQATDPLAGIAIPLRLVTEAGTLSFLSTTTVFGTAIDIVLAETVIESFLPADRATAEIVRRLAASA